MSSSRGHSDLERALLVRMVQAIKPSRAAVLVGEQPAVSVAHGMGEDGEPNQELIDKVVRTGGPVMENGNSGSQLAVPYKNPEGTVAGVMYVELAPPRRLKNRDLAILQGLGRQVEEKLWPAGGEPISSAGRVIVRVSGQLGQAAVAAGDSLTQLAERLNPERGAVFVEQDGELQVLAALGLPLEEFLSKAPVSMPLLEHIWSRGRPVFIEDARNEIRYREFDGVVRYRIRSVAACPLKGSDGVNRGLIYLDSCIKSGVFSSSELNTLGDQALELQAELGELLESTEGIESRDRTDAAIEMVLSLSAELGDLIDDSQSAEQPGPVDTPSVGVGDSESLVDAELPLPDVVGEDEYVLSASTPATYDSDDEYALPDVLPPETPEPPVVSPVPAIDPVEAKAEADTEDEADTLFPEESLLELQEAESVADEEDVDEDEDVDEEEDEAVQPLGGGGFSKKPSLPPVFTKKRLLTRPRLRRPLSNPVVTEEAVEEVGEGQALEEMHDRADLRLERHPSTWGELPEQPSTTELEELEPLLKAPAPKLYESLPTSDIPQVQTKKSHRVSSPWQEPENAEEQSLPASEKPGKRRRSGRPLGAVDFEELSRLEKLEKEGESKEKADVAWAFESLGVSGGDSGSSPAKHTTGELFLYPPGEEPAPVPRPIRETTGELFLYPPGEEPEAAPPRAVKETTGELFLYPPGEQFGGDENDEESPLLELRRDVEPEGSPESEETELAEEVDFEPAELEVEPEAPETEDDPESTEEAELQQAELELEVPHTELEDEVEAEVEPETDVPESEDEPEPAEEAEPEQAELELEVPHTELEDEVEAEVEPETDVPESEDEPEPAEEAEPEQAELELEVPHAELEDEVEAEAEPDDEPEQDWHTEPTVPGVGPVEAEAEAEAEHAEVTTLTVEPSPEYEHDLELEEQPEATLEDEIPAVASEPSEQTQSLDLDMLSIAPGSTVQISAEDADKVRAALANMSEQAEEPTAATVAPEPEHQPEALPTKAESLPAPAPEPSPEPSWFAKLWQKIWPWAKSGGPDAGLSQVSVVGTVMVEGSKVGESPVEVTLVFPTHQMRVVLELPPAGAKFRYHGSFPDEQPTHLHLIVRKTGFAPVKLSNVTIIPVDGSLRGQVADITLMPIG